MIITIDKTQEIKDRLEKEGKKVTYLDKKEDLEAIDALDRQMEEVRREYKLKDRESQVLASQSTLTD